MTKFFSTFLNIFVGKSTKEKELIQFIKLLTGQKPANISIYFLALKHSSLSRHKKELISTSNERLEFLGDAVLGAVIAEYLFRKFPFKDEGFLTEVRSRIVNGESLGKLAKTIGLSKFIEFNTKNKSSSSHKSMHGDAMEALIGAVYLDHGFKCCKKFILEKLIENHLDIEEIVSTDDNYKSKVIIWAQSMGKSVRFDIVSEEDHKHYKEFTSQIFIDDLPVQAGKGTSKKKADQDAARRYSEQLKLNS